MITTILFDLDDTILDFHKAEAIAITRALTKMDIVPTNEIISTYSEINNKEWQLLEKGEITRAQCLHDRFEILFEQLGVNKDSHKMQNLYETFLSQGHYFIEGAEDILKTLYKNYDLYLVSNGTTRVQEGRLKSADISKYFKDIFVSEKIGYDKPSVKYFEYCFSHIKNFEKSKTVIVGDSLSSDILGGINAGITTIWYNPHHKQQNKNIVPNYTIDTLYDLIALIKSL